jgi:predicted nucleic acid-binding protein
MAEPDEKIVQVVNHLSHVFEEKKVEVVNNLNQIFEEEKKQLLEQAAQAKQQLLVEYDQLVKNKDENEMMLKEEIEILKKKLYGQKR